MSKKFYQNPKFWLGAVLLVGLAAALMGPSLYLRWQINQKQEAARQELIEPLRQDNVGGQTPEETMDLFIAALEAGDLKLASQYFWPEDQAEQLARFQRIQDAGQMEEFITKWKDGRQNWTNEGEDLMNFDDKKQFAFKVFEKEEFTTEIDGIEVTFPAGEGREIVTFTLNPFTKVWKISNL